MFMFSIKEGNIKSKFDYYMLFNNREYEQQLAKLMNITVTLQ